MAGAGDEQTGGVPEMPEELSNDLAQIMAAHGDDVSPSEEIEELDRFAAEISVSGDQEDEDDPLAGLPVSPISGDPEDGVVPGPNNPSRKAVNRLVNVTTRAYDLSDETDARDYSAELEKIFNPESKRVLSAQQMPPSIMLDPTAPKGYRVVVVLTTADTDVLVIKAPEYDLIERSKLKRNGT